MRVDGKMVGSRKGEEGGEKDQMKVGWKVGRE
jgi:hypothetical protein